MEQTLFRESLKSVEPALTLPRASIRAFIWKEKKRYIAEHFCCVSTIAHLWENILSRADKAIPEDRTSCYRS